MEREWNFGVSSDIQIDYQLIASCLTAKDPMITVCIGDCRNVHVLIHPSILRKVIPMEDLRVADKFMKIIGSDNYTSDGYYIIKRKKINKLTKLVHAIKFGAFAVEHRARKVVQVNQVEIKE